MRGGERQRETVEEMVGGKRVQKCNSRLYMVQKAEGRDEVTPGLVLICNDNLIHSFLHGENIKGTDIHPQVKDVNTCV